jgi:hypothetical protein
MKPDDINRSRASDRFRHYLPLLYLPADRPGAEQLVVERAALIEKFNVVICLEDAVRVADRKDAARRVGIGGRLVVDAALHAFDFLDGVDERDLQWRCF